MNGKIYVSSTGISIMPYKKGQSKALEYKTSMRDPGMKFKRIPTSGFFLTDRFLSYHIPKVFLDNEFPGYEYVEVPVTDAKRFDSDFRFEINNKLEPTELQYSVINQIMEDRKNNRWFIHCPQGQGKTFISINLIAKFRMNAMIMCYSVEILNQWRKQIAKCTNCEMSKILLIDSGAIITKILNDTFPYDEYNIFIVTPMMLVKYGNSHGLDTITELFKKLRIGIKIFDEAHRNLANMVKIDALTSVMYSLYLSGDFAQAGEARTRLFYDIFRDAKLIRPKVDMEKLKYTDAVIVEYNTHPTALESVNLMNRRGMSQWKYMDYQMEKGTLMKIIIWIIDNILKLKEADRRILILTSKIEHCDIIHERVCEKFPDVSIGKYHGMVPDDEADYVKDNSHIIVATYSSFSTGMDTSNIKYVISSSLSNRVEDSQASGRARPLGNGEIVLFWMLIDIGFEKLVSKERSRINYLYDLKIRHVSRITYESED